MIPISKKRLYIVLLIVLVTILNISLGFYNYTNTINKNNDYTSFQKDYYDAYDNFISTNFMKKAELKNSYDSISFPKNNFFSSKNDNFNNDPLMPRNRKIMFMDKNGSILFRISYLYANQNLNTDLITVDYTSETNIQELISINNIKINDSFQFIITYHNSLILIDCSYILDDFGDEQQQYFYSQVKLFFKEFTDFLKEYSDK